MEPTAPGGGLDWNMSAAGAAGACTAAQVLPPFTVFRISTREACSPRSPRR